MKRGLIFAATALSTALAFAGGVENKTNMSTGYLRNPSRNAESQRPEAAFYNIAGTAFMDDGLWIEIGNQFVLKDYTHEINDDNLQLTFKSKNIETASSDTTDVWLYPDVDLVVHKKNFAGFFNFGVYAGGGSLNFYNGSSLIAAKLLESAKLAQAAAQQYATAAAGGAPGAAVAAQKSKVLAQGIAGAAADHVLKVKSITYGGEIGGAYKLLDDRLSFAGAFRMVYGTQSMELTSKSAYFKAANGGDSIGYDAKAIGFGAVFGVHARPVEKLDLSLQYATINKIKYEVDNVEGNLASGVGIEDGKKFNTDLPATLSFGASYSVIDSLLISFSFNYYFNRQADMDSVLGENDYNNSFEFAFGTDYKFNDKVGASLGFAYSKQGATEDANSPFSPVLDSICIGGGVEIFPVERFTLTAAGMWVYYFDVKDYKKMFKLSKEVFMTSIGMTYHLPF